jgi:hypothetical protein
MQSVSPDPRSESFNRLVDLQQVVPPGEILTAVLDAIDDRVAEIKAGWNDYDIGTWGAVAAGVLDEDKS